MRLFLARLKAISEVFPAAWLIAIMVLMASVSFSSQAAYAYTTCSPGSQSGGTETCSGTINSGVAYSPIGDLRLNVATGSQIAAGAGESGILIPGPVTTTAVPIAALCDSGTLSGGQCVSGTTRTPDCGSGAWYGTYCYDSLHNTFPTASCTPHYNLSANQCVPTPYCQASTLSADGNTCSNSATATTTGPAPNTNVNVSVAQGATITSSTASGISVQTGSGNVTVTNAGTITASAGVGVQLTTVSGALTVVNSGTVTGSAGVTASSTSGSMTITNAGTITGTGGVAISTDGGIPTTLSNAGTINGNVNLTEGSTFVNNGAFNVTGGSSSLLGGVLNNNAGGSINVIGAATLTTGTLSNAGTINLASGAPGNSLTLRGSYAGNSGQVNESVSSQAKTADTLYISGNATGTTKLNVSNVTQATPFTTSTPLVVVTGTVSSNAFVLGTLTGFGRSGNIAPVLIQNAGTYALGFAPTAQGISAGAVATTAARTIAWVGNEAVLDRVTELRDALRKDHGQPGAEPLAYADYQASANPASAVVKEVPAAAAAPKLATWARAYGDLENRSGSTSFAFGGNPYNYDMGYFQSSGGLLGGGDAIFTGITKSSDALIVGVVGGYTASNVNLKSGVSEQFSGGTVGAYSTYLNGPLFVDLLGKVDLLGVNISGVDLSQSVFLQNYSIVTNAGYKVDLRQNWYAEPTAGLEYVRSIYDQTTSLTTSTVALNDGYIFRGRIGARTGVEWTANNVRYEPSVTAFAYNVFSASQLPTALLNAGGGGITLPSDVNKTRGEIQASITVVDLGSGWSGFARGDLRFQDNLIGGGGKTGVRYQW
jgi:outer membrane autotransporter protein